MQTRVVADAQTGEVREVPLTQADLDQMAVDREESGWRVLRVERDLRLDASDQMMAPDRGLTDEQRAAWAAYRQALRDLPSSTTDPWAVVWPVPPQ